MQKSINDTSPTNKETQPTDGLKHNSLQESNLNEDGEVAVHNPNEKELKHQNFAFALDST